MIAKMYSQVQRWASVVQSCRMHVCVRDELASWMVRMCECICVWVFVCVSEWVHGWVSVCVCVFACKECFDI